MLPKTNQDPEHRQKKRGKHHGHARVMRVQESFSQSFGQQQGLKPGGNLWEFPIMVYLQEEGKTLKSLQASHKP